MRCKKLSLSNGNKNEEGGCYVLARFWLLCFDWPAGGIFYFHLFSIQSHRQHEACDLFTDVNLDNCSGLMQPVSAESSGSSNVTSHTDLGVQTFRLIRRTHSPKENIDSIGRLSSFPVESVNKRKAVWGEFLRSKKKKLTCRIYSACITAPNIWHFVSCRFSIFKRSAVVNKKVHSW